jgi:hypothetical protein
LFSETVQIKNPCTSSERRKIVELAKERIIEEYGFCFDGNFDNSDDDDDEDSCREKKENEKNDEDRYRNSVNEGCVNDNKTSNNSSDNNNNDNNNIENINNNNDTNSNSNNNDNDNNNDNSNNSYNNSNDNINDNDSNSNVKNIHKDNSTNKNVNDKVSFAKFDSHKNNNATKISMKKQKNIQKSINYFFDDETVTSITDHLTGFPVYSLYLEAISLLKKTINFKLVQYSREEKTRKAEFKSRKSIEKTVKNNMEQHTGKNGLSLSFPLVYGQKIAKNALSESILWPRKLSSLYRTLCPSGTYDS